MLECCVDADVLNFTFVISEMLESPNSEDDPIPVKNAKQSYAACMDTGELLFVCKRCKNTLSATYSSSEPAS